MDRMLIKGITMQVGRPLVASESARPFESRSHEQISEPAHIALRKETSMVVKLYLRAGLIFTLSVLLWPSAAGSLEELAVYEDWKNGTKAQKTIRSDRWRGDEDFGGTEVARELLAKKLNMRYRLEGNVVPSDIPSGSRVARNFLRFTRPTSITAIEATFTVDRKLAFIPCAANNVGAATQAAPTHVALTRFNDGTSTGPGDRTGDTEGVMGTFRNGDSADPPGVLQVFGAIIRSTTPAGDFNSTLPGTLVILGTVRAGETFTLRLVWDKPNKQFIFSLNDHTAASTYSASDSAEAVLPLAHFFQRHVAANCHDSTVVIDSLTKVGTVLTNASAVIP
jgi:hypothetical protein